MPQAMPATFSAPARPAPSAARAPDTPRPSASACSACRRGSRARSADRTSWPAASDAASSAPSGSATGSGQAAGRARAGIALMAGGLQLPVNRGQLRGHPNALIRLRPRGQRHRHRGGHSILFNRMESAPPAIAETCDHRLPGHVRQEAQPVVAVARPIMAISPARHTGQPMDFPCRRR